MSAQLDRLNRRMKAIPLAVREAVKPPLVKGAEEVAAAQRALAPEETGDLKASITVTPPGMPTPAYSQPGGSRVASQLEALVTAGNSDVRYPHLVEHGTAHAPAQPYFWPGFRLTRKRAANRIKRAIAKAVREGWANG
ncbi:HK97-gp10 family putative phage morphogenesis protein [Pseudogemmobacter sonorensis]|uniref:HK97-gp10 family putative phage morphogenesis protein n=1 Tax=Pseudogemmobacter sonorensis TaxID=2989681 RepID=UPI00368B01A0